MTVHSQHNRADFPYSKPKLNVILKIWQADAEDCAFLRCAKQLQGTLMQADNFVGDRQPEARSSLIGPCFVASDERIENHAAQMLRYSNSIVGKFQK
ncbi:hypothetical protein D3C73_489720 [compost metagenome]